MKTKIEKIKKEIEAKQEELRKLEESEKKNDLIEIPELGIKVKKEVSEKMTYSESEKYCKDNNARMLNVLEAGYIFDNDLIKDFCDEWEWLEHYSEKTREKGFACSALDGGWGFGVRLDVVGDYWNDYSGGRSFGVRLVFPITDKARKNKSKGEKQ